MPAARYERRRPIYFVIMVFLASAGIVRVYAADEMGYSYGGEMAAFVQGKTDRFKAIVSAAPVIDQQSEYGTEDESWYDRWFYGKPWEHTTDPLGQSLEMYRALRQQGVLVQMLQYPRDNHGPLGMSMYGFPSTEPWHGFDARRRLVEFIKTAFDKGA
jgi:dipeptidyl aminopeptidase/acylaminoacyl peptidase